HARESCRVVEQAGDLSDEAIGVELALADHHGRTTLGDVLGVGHLMRLRRRREWNEDERDTEGERLGNRGGARASDDEVRRRERRAHLLVKVSVDVIALTELGRQRLALRRDLREMGVAGVVDHCRAAEKAAHRPEDRVVDRSRSLAASGHEQDRAVWGYPELRATRLLRPFQKRAADGVAGDKRATARQYPERTLERRTDPLRPPGEQPVDPSGNRVALPDV